MSNYDASHRRDLGAAQDTLGLVYPLDSEEAALARETLHRAALRWGKRNKRTKRRVQMYYEQACVAAGLLSWEDTSTEYKRFSQSQQNNPGAAHRFGAEGEE